MDFANAFTDTRATEIENIWVYRSPISQSLHLPGDPCLPGIPFTPGIPSRPSVPSLPALINTISTSCAIHTGNTVDTVGRKNVALASYPINKSHAWLCVAFETKAVASWYFLRDALMRIIRIVLHNFSHSLEP